MQPKPTFQNQLTKQEINRGLIQYISRKAWLIILLLAVMLFAFFTILDFSMALAAGISIFGATAAALLLFFPSGSQLSPEKVATYQLAADHIEIIGSNNNVHQYLYSEIRMICDDSLMILFLPKRRFAIVAKRNLNSEQREFLESRICL